MKIDQKQAPTMADMLGDFPAFNQANNPSLTTSDLTPISSNTHNTSSFYSTSSSTTTEHVLRKVYSLVPKLTPPRTKQYSKSQQLNQIPEFDNKVPCRSISSLIEERTDGNGNRLSVKDGELANHFVDAAFHNYFFSFNYFRLKQI